MTDTTRLSASDRMRQGGKYEERYISFIDILGFADMIARSEADPDLVSDLYQALLIAPSSSPLIGPPWYPNGYSYAEIQTTHFSDSLVISAARSPEGLMTVLEITRAFACVLLQHGLLCRGGVAGGKVVHTDHVLFGPAMVRAYRIESTEARYARIILGDECSTAASALAESDDPIGEYFRETLRTDQDGAVYIHALRELEQDILSAEEPRHGEWWWGKVRQTVSAYLAASEGRPHQDKVAWFCDYFDRCLGASEEIGNCAEWKRPFSLGAAPASDR